MSGIELITQERNNQLLDPKRSVGADVAFNTSGQLAKAASILMYNYDGCLQEEDIIEEHCPEGWYKHRWADMVKKPYKERLIIAGALAAAEIDRIDFKSHYDKKDQQPKPRGPVNPPRIEGDFPVG